MVSKKVCVVGAGVSGLTMTRHLLAIGVVPTVLEQTSQIGGTWVYSENAGTDQFGLPVISSTYKNLKTNIPEELMQFPDFPIEKGVTSYFSSTHILKYLQAYAEKFDINRHIKFNHRIKFIKPSDNGWSVKYENLVTKKETTENFDILLICNGHYSVPFIPQIEGLNTFKGEVTHSHSYRVPEVYEGKTVLVLGAGPSGLDIGVEISAFAKKVILSHNLTDRPDTKLPDNMIVKKGIAKLEELKAIFIDGSQKEIDALVLCTGYTYDYSFLDSSCCIKVDENYVTPLYKHMFNIEHPTMCFIGIPGYVCPIIAFDLQARYFIAWFTGKFKLPSKQKMYDSSKAEFEELMRSGQSKRKAHVIGPEQGKYYDSLAEEAKITPVPPVVTEMYIKAIDMLIGNTLDCRNYKYKMLDDKTFTFNRVSDT